MFLIKTKTFHYDFLWRVSLSLLSLPPSAGLESKPRDRNLKGMDNCRLRAVGLECVWSLPPVHRTKQSVRLSTWRLPRSLAPGFSAFLERFWLCSSIQGPLEGRAFRFRESCLQDCRKGGLERMYMY